MCNIIVRFILQDPEPGDEDEDDKDKKKDKSSSGGHGTLGSTDPNNKRKESKKDDQVLKKE